MKKANKYIRIIAIWLCAASLAMMSSCAKDDAPKEIASRGMLTITLSQESYRQDAITRANNALEGMSFGVGDQIGIYATNSNGMVVVANIPFTLTATGWTTTGNITYAPDFTYYAYYPYKSTLSGAPTVGTTISTPTADAFFNDAITAWTPAADQSTKAAFNGSDLMVAKGHHRTNKTISFTMSHKMALAVLDITQTRYLTTDASYTWTEKPTFTTNIPYNNRNYYLYLVRPQTNTTVCDNTINIVAGSAKKYTFNISSPYTMQVGDVYYSDGAISRPDNQDDYKTVIGVISYLNDGTSYSNNVCQGKSHALVQALQTAGTGRWGPGEYINYEWVSTEEDPLINEPDMTDITTMTLLLSDVDGIANTDKLVAKHGDGTGVGQYYVAGYLARTYSAERPADATEWFLGAAGQWAAIFNGLSQTAVSKDVIDASTPWWAWLNNNATYHDASVATYNAYKALFTNAGGWFNDASFWTSSEYSQGYAVNFKLDGGESRGLLVYIYSKYYVLYVRPFLCF